MAGRDPHVSRSMPASSTDVSGMSACSAMSRGWAIMIGWIRPSADEVPMNVQDERVAAFGRLHSSGCFVMPNPWDVGSVRALERFGFKALATTSAGLAWTLGRADSHGTLEQTLEHLRVVVDAVDVPVNADFEGGFAVDPEQANVNVNLLAYSGGTPGDRSQWYGHRCDRPVQGLRRRTSRHRRNVQRLRGYAQAGADCLYAPRIGTVEQISAIIAAVAPKPVNLLINAPFITVAEATALGVRRISVGGTLARTAWAGFLQATHEIADAGTFSQFERLPDVDALFRPR